MPDWKDVDGVAEAMWRARWADSKFGVAFEQTDPRSQQEYRTMAMAAIHHLDGSAPRPAPTPPEEQDDDLPESESESEIEVDDNDAEYVPF